MNFSVVEILQGSTYCPFHKGIRALAERRDEHIRKAVAAFTNDKPDEYITPRMEVAANIHRSINVLREKAGLPATRMPTTEEVTGYPVQIVERSFKSVSLPSDEFPQP